MAAKWIELLVGPLEQKKQYKEAKARLDALPAPYRSAASAVNRYLMYYGGVTDGDTTVQMFSTWSTCGSARLSTARSSKTSRGPGGVRREFRAGLWRQALDRPGAGEADQRD